MRLPVILLAVRCHLLGFHCPRIRNPRRRQRLFFALLGEVEKRLKLSWWIC